MRQKACPICGVGRRVRRIKDARFYDGVALTTYIRPGYWWRWECMGDAADGTKPDTTTHILCVYGGCYQEFERRFAAINGGVPSP